ncbi:MAG: hypothetical protein ACHREM_09460 [Polyangiales bacterium]
MKQVLVARTVVVGMTALLAAALVAPACSTTDDDSTDASVDAVVVDSGVDSGVDTTFGAPACTEGWCTTVASYCAAFVPCLGAPPDADNSSCTNGVGAVILYDTADASESAQDLANALLGCAQDAGSCYALSLCGKLLQGPDAGADAPRPAVDAPDATSPVDSTIADAGYLPEGAVPIWGTDNLHCVDCAYTQCTSVLSHCFVDTSTTPACIVDGGKAYPDCCKDYRQCLAQCNQWSLGDAGSYALCASQRCDVDYPNGKLEFGPYQTCMVANCAGCAGSDAGGPG